VPEPGEEEISMRVIGVVGLNGSGKDELLNHLGDEFHIHVVSAGDVARDIAYEEGIVPTRSNLHDISRRYMAERGKDFFMNQLIEETDRHNWDVVGISGIRTPEDVRLLRERYGQDFLLIYVQVDDPLLRYMRIRRRDEDRDQQSYLGFLKQDCVEEQLFRISQTIKQADLTINNEGNLDRFHRRIDTEVIQKMHKEVLVCV
jgi:dephospho-CoA kinase